MSNEAHLKEKDKKKGCSKCNFRVKKDDFLGCSNPDIINEHIACCRNISTGFTAIGLPHAKIEHEHWCPSMGETTVQEFRRRSQTESVIISVFDLLRAKKQGKKVRKASPFGLTSEEAGYIYSIDGCYFRCNVNPDWVKILLEEITVGGKLGI